MAAFRMKRDNGPTAAVNTVFFDLDNTLIETRKGDSLTCRQLTEELTLKYGVSRDDASKITGSYLKQFRKCPDNKDYPLDTWRCSLWSKALGENYSHLTEEIYERWLNLRYQYLALSSEIVGIITHLRKKYFLGLITNGPTNAQWEKINKLDLEQYFDVILVSGDLPWEKPEARIFEEGCQYLNVNPENCIMVGDKLETDILGGIRAGLAGTVWLPLSGDKRLLEHGPKPDYTIKHIAEIMKILSRGPSAPELEDSSSNASDGM